MVANVVMGLAGKLLANEGVKALGIAALERGGSDLWTRLFDRQPAEVNGQFSIDSLSVSMSNLPTREELATAFTLLEAKLARSHRVSVALQAISIMLGLLILILLIFR